MAEQKQNKLQTTTPVSLFTTSKYVNMNYNNKIIEGTVCNGWRSVGFVHVIEPKQKVIIETMALSPRADNNILYYSVGVAPKNLIETNGHNQVGMYTNGFNYHCNGYIYYDGKQGKPNRPVASMQRLRLEIQNYKINVFVENKKITTFDATSVMNNKEKQFYPFVAINGNAITIQVIDFTVQ